MSDADRPRRKFLRTIGIAVAVAPVVLASRPAIATTNAELRAKLKYQDTPQGGLSCATCMAFQPGKSEKDLGKCNLIPGDDEISPKGYCTAWFTM